MSCLAGRLRKIAPAKQHRMQPRVAINGRDERPEPLPILVKPLDFWNAAEPPQSLDKLLAKAKHRCKSMEGRRGRCSGLPGAGVGSILPHAEQLAGSFGDSSDCSGFTFALHCASPTVLQYSIRLSIPVTFFQAPS